jgi:hypothetical protein
MIGFASNMPETRYIVAMTPEKAVQCAITHWHLSRPTLEQANIDLAIAKRSNRVYDGIYQVNKISTSHNLSIEAILIGGEE